jgi:hypothetical protein
VDNARMAEVYSAIDLLVLPDMRCCQGYSTAAQEALMCGAEVAVGGLAHSYYPKEEGVFFFDPTAPANWPSSSRAKPGNRGAKEPPRAGRYLRNTAGPPTRPASSPNWPAAGEPRMIPPAPPEKPKVSIVIVCMKQAGRLVPLPRQHPDADAFHDL